MATDGTEGGAPFTLIELKLPGDSGEKIRIRRKSGATTQVDIPVISGGRLSTGDRDFDDAFRIEGDNQLFASTLLDSDVRRQLLSASPRGVEARVERNKIAVTMEGIARSAEDLEVLIETAGLLADHCPRTVGLPESADS